MLVAVRLLIMLFGLLAGWVAGEALSASSDSPVATINTLSLMLAGLLLSVLLLSRGERVASTWLGHFETWYAGLPPRQVAAATFGLVIALLLSVLLANLLRSLPFYSWVISLTVTVVLAVFFVGYSVQHAEAFSFLSLPQMRRKPGGKILDSNVIIDGRIVELSRTGFLEGELIVPAFVLRELQVLADHADAQKRTRGKRGLSVLEELRALRPLRVEDWDDPNLSTVDDKLIRLARETGGKLVTNDGNLSKIAKLHGLQVLSIHEAAVALKPQLQAGDHLTIVITKNGQQSGQGVGYLDDGTMVVVEDGLKFRGRPTRVQVVNNVQTNVGRMIFARPDKDGPGKDGAEKGDAA